MDLLLLLLMVVMMGIIFDEFGYIMGFVLKKSSVSEWAWGGKYPQILAVSPVIDRGRPFPLALMGIYIPLSGKNAPFLCVKAFPIYRKTIKN
jgi:hypothetical protein